MIHFRQAKMCSRGTREFFQRNGFDWSEFLKHGMDEAILEATGDAMVMQVIRNAHGR